MPASTSPRFLAGAFVTSVLLVCCQIDRSGIGSDTPLVGAHGGSSPNGGGAAAGNTTSTGGSGAAAGTPNATGGGSGTGGGGGNAGGGGGGSNPVDYALRFFGHGRDQLDRVKIRVDDPTNNDAGPPADIGAADFTIEFWVRGLMSENTAPAITCGNNGETFINQKKWVNGNTIIDRNRWGQGADFGATIAGGKMVFGITSASNSNMTICGSIPVLSDSEPAAWHHVVLQRRVSASGGQKKALAIYVDGVLDVDVQISGTLVGDISYPDNGVPQSKCGTNASQSCDNEDPFLVLGADKHDQDQYMLDGNTPHPSFSGWMDEVRISKVARYDANFTRPAQPFAAGDADTVALYHFNEGPSATMVLDSSGAVGGPSNGAVLVGGPNNGPQWVAVTPFTP